MGSKDSIYSIARERKKNISGMKRKFYNITEEREKKDVGGRKSQKQFQRN